MFILNFTPALVLHNKYLGKDKKLYAAFMDLEKAYNRVDREALWSVLCIYGVGGQLLKGIPAFYRGANACVRVRVEGGEGGGGTGAVVKGREFRGRLFVCNVKK